MDNFPQALAHNGIEQIFPNVFFVTGEMQTVLMEKDWQFSRNMTIVREGDRLVIFNSVRLDEKGLAELNKLGTVTDVVRVGALHGRDDEFYVNHYNATYWALPGMETEFDLPKVKTLTLDAELPIADAKVFLFEKAQLPESVIHLDREGGIIIGCDAIQNWGAPDEFFSAESTAMMTEMGFFTPANVGPVWAQVAGPNADDFVALKKLSFKHALCGHGTPLLNTAYEDYSQTFAKMFGI